MRKIAIACLCIFIFITLPLFAEWKIGNVVDDFGDPTGEKFVYTIVEGTFSNSATASSPCSIRVLAQFSVTPFPEEEWIFEIHEYGFDNPVNNFSSSSEANIKLKDDSGKIYSYDTQNYKYANHWNRLRYNNAKQLTELLANNNKIKVAVSCGSTRYNFEVPADGANEVIDTVVSSIPPNTRKWIRVDEEPFMLEFYEYFIGKYKALGISKTFPLYKWKYYDIVNVSDVQYQINLTVHDEDLAKDGYAKFSASAYAIDNQNATDKPYGTITKVTFIINGKDYSLVVENPEESSLIFKNMSEMTKITKALESSNFTSISILFVENIPPLTITIDGKEMARIIASL